MLRWMSIEVSLGAIKESDVLRMLPQVLWPKLMKEAAGIALQLFDVRRFPYCRDLDARLWNCSVCEDLFTVYMCTMLAPVRRRCAWKILDGSTHVVKTYRSSNYPNYRHERYRLVVQGSRLQILAPDFIIQLNRVLLVISL